MRKHLKRIYRKFTSIRKVVLNFYLPNLKLIRSKRLNFAKHIPLCNQATYLTGPGSFFFGENCSFGFRLGGFHRGGAIEFQARTRNSVIKIGDNTATNNNVLLIASNYIEIGSNSLIGQYVTIMDFEAHGIEPAKRREVGQVGKVIIGENVWIGNNVTILKNTQIGNNTIVATGAVVSSGIFPANVVIGGVPAKVIKYL